MKRTAVASVDADADVQATTSRPVILTAEHVQVGYHGTNTLLAHDYKTGAEYFAQAFGGGNRGKAEIETHCAQAHLTWPDETRRLGDVTEIMKEVGVVVDVPGKTDVLHKG